MSNICIHVRDPKHEIYVLFFSFWGGKPPEADEGSALEPRWGTSLPQAFLALPQPLTPGDATESNRTIVVTCIGASFLRKFLQCVSPPLASRRSARLSSADALSRIKYRN